MSTIETGGPAFPTSRINMAGEVVPDEEGMNLRDYFAAAAMSGGLEQGIRDNMDATWWRKPSECAKRAYAIADAMLAARKAGT